MKKEELELWGKDITYYDPKNIELNTLLRLVNFKGKRVLDVGCGIARLTLPISKHVKEIVAIDVNKDIIKYCKRKKQRKNIQYILSDIKKFKEKEFDIAIFAQPEYKHFKENLSSIKNSLNDKGKLVIIKWIDRENEYNAILTPFWKKDPKLMRDVTKFTKTFRKNLGKFFKIKKIELIKTCYSFPNQEAMIKNIVGDISYKLDKKEKDLLNKLAEKYNHKKLKVAMKIYLCEKRLK